MDLSTKIMLQSINLVLFKYDFKAVYDYLTDVNSTHLYLAKERRFKCHIIFSIQRVLPLPFQNLQRLIKI